MILTAINDRKQLMDTIKMIGYRAEIRAIMNVRTVKEFQKLRGCTSLDPVCTYRMS